MKVNGSTFPLFSFILGPVVSILVMKGVIAPSDANAAVQGAEVWGGVILFLGSLLVGALHHTELNKYSNETEPVKSVEQPAQPAA